MPSKIADADNALEHLCPQPAVASRPAGFRVSGVLMDEPGELTPTVLPLGAVLVGVAVWLLARLTARREAARYERSVTP